MPLRPHLSRHLPALLLYPDPVLPHDPLDIGRVHDARDKDVIDPLREHGLGACRLHDEREAVGLDLLQEFCEVLLGHVQGAGEHDGIGAAGRNGLDPASRNKVVNVMARDNMGEKDARANIEREIVTSPSGKNCTTNVGTPKVNEGTNGIGNRYGAGNNDQVTVVRGSVINICK